MKKIRTDKFKMTQAEFARAVGVNQSTVNRWEKGSLPSLEQVPKIVSAAKKTAYQDGYGQADFDVERCDEYSRMTWHTIILIWIAVSILLGLIVGGFIHVGKGSEE